MNKKDSIRRVSRQTGYSYHDVQTILEALVAEWSAALVAGETIALAGFLTLRVTRQAVPRSAARFGTVRVSQISRVTAVCSPGLRQRLNQKG